MSTLLFFDLVFHAYVLIYGLRRKNLSKALLSVYTFIVVVHVLVLTVPQG